MDPAIKTRHLCVTNEKLLCFKHVRSGASERGRWVPLPAVVISIISIIRDGA